MKGTVITLPCSGGGVVTPIDDPPTLAHLQAETDGADVEMVPGFDTIEHARRCSIASQLIRPVALALKICSVTSGSGLNFGKLRLQRFDAGLHCLRDRGALAREAQPLPVHCF
jgi:hypothetical protein